MREEENNQRATEDRTGGTSQQEDAPKGDETSLTQPATSDSRTKEDERTGEGTGSRAGEYS